MQEPPVPNGHVDPRIGFFDRHAGHWSDDKERQAAALRRLEDLGPRLPLVPGQQLLEVGCGPGHITPWLADRVKPGRVTAVDFSPAMLAQARAKGIAADFHPLDICEAAPMEQAYDVALCFQSFPHFRNPSMALRHLGKALKPQGRLLVLHFTGSEQINVYHRRVGGVVAHDFLPAPQEWPGLLTEAGLSLQSLEDRPDLFLLQAARV